MFVICRNGIETTGAYKTEELAKEFIKQYEEAFGKEILELENEIAQIFEEQQLFYEIEEHRIIFGHLIDTGFEYISEEDIDIYIKNKNKIEELRQNKQKLTYKNVGGAVK